MEKIYVVTLHRYDDLEPFYEEMKSSGYRLSLKRPISRNTHYWMTDAQAAALRQDSRVLACEQTPEALGATPEKFVVNREPWTITGDFWKEDTIKKAEKLTGLKYNSVGEAATALGIDAYQVPLPLTQMDEVTKVITRTTYDYWVILNRSAIIVSDTVGL